ncbi:radical SAM protein [Chryseobacterium indologenes]|uniref:B12-binding domain-containing radical SAM protein n=1 Tax=Chryseobacterium indologenes TaxID=253 RepID=UPI000F4E3060|nr:radical SAM protein [Chryseobacterium indologenes]AYZ35611.1 radical SAM protein [Chryseobacterium indologenes]MBF6644371.1 radical SAM protein [Chryseobacterium indologenes]MBU3049065.1 radical SAM protein [Chryseobacterium indologenes]MEB4759971.1 B12-binding domain-containing radical SAM protein [Chryseobacterium indologenes]QQQ71921.1 radical SAM protein [Chryseobacterium indologenes]
MKDLLLITPPFTQLNTPYPATAYIKGFLNTKNISSYQVDLGIDVILELFSRDGLEKVFSMKTDPANASENSRRIFALREEYLKTIDQVIPFLQGKTPTLARQICSMNFLPEASRFNQLDDMEFAFGNMGLQDKAKHLATLYLEDISDYIVENMDADFGFSRYAERLGKSANSFDELYSKLSGEQTFIDDFTLKILREKIEAVEPKLVCFSVPFPGNLYSGFKCAQFIKKNYPHIKIAMGGGFPNTELREVQDQRVFEFFDFITLDDGEVPLELLCENVVHSKENPEYKRTFLLEDQQVVYKNNSKKHDYKQADIGTPDYTDLKLDQYISVIEIANPMHSLWSDGRWNKLTMAHGCYWGKCTFCDISLDYIKIYEPVSAKILVDRMEELIKTTGETGFHFVDEAAPPALMREVALEILRRNLVVTWWTNIRFEKSFTRDLCYLLKLSGCVAVSGGLEVASDRLLKLIDKGVSVEQVAKVTRNFTEAGIMVHAYLMYGYPTQTVQETVDSLEMVRQMFEMGILQSGFWHQFAMTAHSPVGMSPEDFGVVPVKQEIHFANNDIDFKDKTGIDHNKFSFGLKKSLFNYMHGVNFEMSLQEWFDFKIPRTNIHPDYIHDCLLEENEFVFKGNSKIVFLTKNVIAENRIKNKKKYSGAYTLLTFHLKTNIVTVELEQEKAEWLMKILEEHAIENLKKPTVQQLKNNFEENFEDFELFWFSKPMQQLKENGVILSL